jgi:Uma2 family endonuclease
MATLVKLGPKDHGRPLSYDEFLRADAAEGYHYELIDGKVYVSPPPNAPEGFVERWIGLCLQRYSDAHPEVINYVHPKARVFVPGRSGVTAPEPDVAAYADFPLDLPVRDLRWPELGPILVVEVISEDDPDKDLVRNAALYFQVPSVREYWVIDPRTDPEELRLRVHRRYGRRWVIREFGPDDTYTTRLLPGFRLVLNPRS